jgi:hypothetical protein
LIEATEAGENHLRIAGMMHEPEGGAPVVWLGRWEWSVVRT